MFLSTKSRTLRSVLLGSIIVSLLIAVLSGCGKAPTFDERLENAQNYIKEAEYSSAIIELKNALSEKPDHIVARRLIADLYFQVGDIVRASNEWKRLWLSEKEDADRIRYVRTLIILFDLEEAESLLSSNLSQNPTLQTQERLLRARILLDRDQAAKVTKILNSSDLDSIDVESLLIKARYLVATSDNKGALKAVEKVLEQNVTSRRAWNMKGWLFMAREQYSEAEESFQKGISIQAVGEDVLALKETVLGKMRAQLMQAKYSDVIAVGDIWGNKFKYTAGLSHLKALAYYQQFLFEDARRELNEVLSVNSSEMSAAMLMAAVQYKLRNYEQARLLLRRIIANKPDHQVALRLLGEIELSTGNADLAFEVLSPLVDSSEGDDHELIALVGEAAMRSGRIESGLEYLEMGLEKSGQGRQQALQYAAGLLHAGKYKEAISLLESLLVSKQTPYVREELLLNAYITAKQDGRVERLTSELFEASSEKTEALLFSARAAAKIQLMDRALGFVNRAQQLSPQDARVLVTKAVLFRAQGKIDDAVDLAKQALEIESDNQTIAMFYASLWVGKGKVETATEFLEKFAETNEDHARVLMLLTSLYEMQNETESALSTIEMLLKAPGKRTEYLEFAIDFCLRNKQTEFADTLLADMEKTSTNKESYLRLATEVHLMSGRVERARQSAMALTEVASKEPMAVILLARIDLLEGEFRSVIDRLEELDAGGEVDLIRILTLGEAYQGLEEIENASFWYSKGLAQQGGVIFAQRLLSIGRESAVVEWSDENPEDIQIRVLLAEHYSVIGKHRQAASMYERLLTNSSSRQYAEWLNNLAWNYSQLGDRRALDVARKAYESYSNNPAIMDTYGWILVKNGEVEKGKEILQSALMALADSPEVHYHLAYAHAELGEKQLALDTLKRLFALERQDFADANAAQSLHARLSN